MHLRILRRALLVGVVAALSACESGTGPARPAEGEIIGTWAGARYRGRAEAVLYRDTLYIFGSAPAGGGVSRDLRIRIGSGDGPGRYDLRADDGGIWYVVGGDMIWATYSIPAGETGTLVLTQNDGETVAGTVEFEAETAADDPPAGPRARFQGEFRARVSAQ